MLRPWHGFLQTVRIAGALPEAELVALLAHLGFVDVVVKERFDCFRGTSKERVAMKYGVVGVNVHARKPRWR
jgi:hypothetical protein